MKCKFSRKTFQQPDLWVTYTDSDVRTNVESDFHSPTTLTNNIPSLEYIRYLGCINTKFYTVLCIKIKHMLTLRGILAIILYNILK
jgi:hypothetical protein